MFQSFPMNLLFALVIIWRRGRGGGILVSLCPVVYPLAMSFNEPKEEKHRDLLLQIFFFFFFFFFFFLPTYLVLL